MIKEQTNQTFKGRQTKNKLKKIKILSKKKKKSRVQKQWNFSLSSSAVTPLVSRLVTLRQVWSPTVAGGR
jgi:hypothetical protein